MCTTAQFRGITTTTSSSQAPHQWIDAIASYFGSANQLRSVAVALALVLCAAAVTVASLTLSVGAAVIQGGLWFPPLFRCGCGITLSCFVCGEQGQFTNSSDVVTAQRVADNVWVRGNNIMLLVLVTLPVLLNAILLVMCIYAVWKLQHAATKESHVIGAALRMAVILGVMVACDVTRAAIICIDVFVGAPPPVKYYVGYMASEAVPLIAMLVLVALALRVRGARDTLESAQMDSMTSDTLTSDAPLLDPSAYDY
jgi:hypothetical protein